MKAQSKQKVLRAVDRAIAHSRESLAAKTPIERTQLAKLHESLVTLRTEAESYPSDDDFHLEMIRHDMPLDLDRGVAEDAHISMLTERAAHLTDAESINQLSQAVRLFLRSKGK